MREFDPDCCKEVGLFLLKEGKEDYVEHLGDSLGHLSILLGCLTAASHHDHDLTQHGTQRLRTLRREGLGPL